ncbi:MAG TPA: 30S ribosomal protein S16 [Lentisphaeria bacterium]|nr:30S ribosomal protein S16 [Lentisphaeria bacterium]
MKRVGGKNEPRFRLVVADIRHQRDGNFIEEVGSYNPVKNERNIRMDRIEYWLSKGAKPSETVQSMINYARKQAGKTDAAAVQPKAEAEKKEEKKEEKKS